MFAFVLVLFMVGLVFVEIPLDTVLVLHVSVVTDRVFCVNARAHTHTHAHMHTNTHVCMQHTQSHTYMQATHTHTHIHATHTVTHIYAGNTHMHTCAHTHPPTHPPTHLHTHTHTHANGPGKHLYNQASSNVKLLQLTVRMSCRKETMVCTGVLQDYGLPPGFSDGTFIMQISVELEHDLFLS